MKNPLLLKIMLNDNKNGYLKALRCLDNTFQVIEEMKFSKGTIIISKSETITSIDIMQGGSSEAWIIEDQWNLWNLVLWNIAKGVIFKDQTS